MQVLPAYRLYTGPAGEAFDRLAAHPTYKAICNTIVWDGVVDRLNHSHRRAFVLGLILARVRYWLREWRDLCELAGFVVEQVVTGEAHGAKSAGPLLRRAQPYEWHQACKLTEAQIKAQCKRGGWWLARRYTGELQTVRLAFPEQISYLNLTGWLVRPCTPTGETYKYGDAL